MRAHFPPANLSNLLAQIEGSEGLSDVRALNETLAGADAATVAFIVEEAAKFAPANFSALNEAMDKDHCRLVDGRVQTAPGHQIAWDAYVEGGWPTLDQPLEYGGQGLPRALTVAVQETFDRYCPAFGMLPVPQRSAARLIGAYGSAPVRAEWLPQLIAGTWGATICISEVDAGSDVGRVRTLAEPQSDGSWLITGEKCWISYGDHPLTDRIGHCVIARTPLAPAGSSGLSLFLVPNLIDGQPNGVFIRRLEEKLGLNGSPTCSMGFEGAQGVLLGSLNRGLAQMFVMITNMRLSVGIQGLGIAAGCADLALQYASERRQGGSGERPVTISNHPDVQRQLLDMCAKVETLRGLLLALANQADLSEFSSDPEQAADAEALTQWLLPIVKTTGGEFAFEVASDAVQVLGGAGYTREWPAEQALRDARVLTIFEGTTGIQALDLLHRRLLRGDRRGLAVFLDRARAAARASSVAEADNFNRCLDTLEAASAKLLAFADDRRGAEAGATAFLHLAGLAATGWIAARLTTFDPEGPHKALAAAGRYWLSDIDHRAALLGAQSVAGADRLTLFDAFSDLH